MCSIFGVGNLYGSFCIHYIVYILREATLEAKEGERIDSDYYANMLAKWSR